jgi:hypothetical protein
LQGSFPERQIQVVKTPATPAEEAAYQRLMEVSFHNLDGRGQGAGQLFRTTLEKALFSSPAACLSTVENRIDRLQNRLQKTRDQELHTTLLEDIDTLEDLRLALRAITLEQFSKYQLLKTQLTQELQWTPKDPEDRLVIFTESLKTLEFLKDHLPADLQLRENQYAVMRGDMRDKELMDVVEQFNRRESPLRLLICSDVASEGINLHHLSHRMVHFDIPWSLMVFQQRNGRIDRYGQTQQPQIRYLLTESTHPKVRGDLRILEVLIEKDEQAGKNIGDPSEFLGVFDQAAEEEKVAEAIEKNNSFDFAAEFAALLNQQVSQSENPLDKFIPAPSANGAATVAQELPRVFANGLEYARAALRWFAERGEKLDASIEGDIFAITAPPSLKQRLNFLPREIRPEHDHFLLTPDKNRIDDEIRRNRQEEDTAWPNVHFLWPLHPVMEWLADRALNAFGRHAAPVVRIADVLAADEHIVLVHGGFPNRRGHVLVQDCFGIRIRAGDIIARLGWQDLQNELQLRPGQLRNRGVPGETQSLQALLPQAVDDAYRHLRALNATYEAEHKSTLAAQRQRLAELKSQHQSQLDAEFARSDQPEAFKTRRRDERQQHIDRMFNDYQHWLDNTQVTEEDPYLQILAIFTGSVLE